MKDTDGDGMYDFIEESYGCDINVIDTDGDGLSDYIEWCQSLTDPLKKDTDGNGVMDGEEDTDGDGLNNLKEAELKTNSALLDSDYDDLSDNDEVFKYKTDPTSNDTDDDGLFMMMNFCLDLIHLTNRSKNSPTSKVAG